MVRRVAAPDRRQESLARWGAAATGWGARADSMRRTTMAVSTWMIDAIGPQPGDTLLELAAGPGDTGFLAAELIQPGGTLICSDLAPEMLTVAQERARRLGIDNVRFKQIDAETSIDIEAASLDGVLCRWGYMLMTDPGTALQETRRVLKPGARVALAAWDGPERNLWSAVPARELIARGLLEKPAPDEPGQFTWAPEGAIAEQLEAAGFVEYEVDAVDFAAVYADVDDWWAMTVDMSSRFAGAVAGLDAGTKAEIRAALAEAAEAFTGPDETIVVPARTWVAVATG
jgi:SAM-dependent methyltransferase